ALVERLESFAGNGVADPVRRFRAEVGGDQRFLNVVEGRRVERGAAGQAGQIVGDLLGSLGKPAPQAVEPAHRATPTSVVSTRPVIRAVATSPLLAPDSATGAKLSAWPLT